MPRLTPLGLLALAALTGPAMAQSVVPTGVANAPDSAPDLPPEANPKVIDRGGLAPRGGTPIESRKTFQETIGTEIYTPIGTEMGAPVQSPRG